jgi:GAF domain-containing protein
MDPVGEISRLRAALRDLVALFSIPVVWIGREPAAIANGLADTLVALSQLDFAFVRLRDPRGVGAVDALRGNGWSAFPEWLQRRLASSDQLSRREIVADVGDHREPCRGVVIPIGPDAEGGLIAAASPRIDFPTEIDQLLLSMAANQAATAFQNARLIHERRMAEEELRGARDKLAKEQAALRQVATLAARESSPRELFAIVAEQVARIVDVPLVRLVRYEPDGSAVELIGGWGESVDPLAIGTHWQLDGPGVLASVWQSGRPARLDDYTDAPGQAAAVVQQAGMRSAVACPITVEGRLWGAIAVLSPRREPLPGNTEARLADFTELVATAIANAESRAELAASEGRARKLATEQAALRRVATLVARESSPEEIFAAVAEEVGRIMKVPLVALVCYEPDGSAIQIVGGWGPNALPVPIGTRFLLDGPSVVESVWHTGRPARTDDSTDVPGEIAAAQRQAGMRSNIASPILVEGRLWGAMGAGSPERLPDDIESRLADFTELRRHRDRQQRGAGRSSPALGRTGCAATCCDSGRRGCDRRGCVLVGGPRGCARV